MVNDDKDGNGLRYGFLKRASGCQIFKDSSLARKSLKFCKTFAAVWTFFKKSFLIIILVKANEVLST